MTTAASVYTPVTIPAKYAARGYTVTSTPRGTGAYHGNGCMRQTRHWFRVYLHGEWIRECKTMAAVNEIIRGA